MAINAILPHRRSKLNSRLLNVEQAAQLLGLGRSKTYQLILRGELKSLKIGRSRRVPVDAIEDFIAELMRKAEAQDDPSQNR